MHQRAGDGHALLLAARELAGPMVTALAEPHPLEQLRRPSARVASGHAGEAHRGHHVAVGAEARDEVERLEHHADRVAAVRREVAPGEAGGLAAVELDGSGRGREEPGQAREQRRLPAARGPEEDDQLAVGGVEAEAVERPHDVATGAELHREVANREVCS